MRSIGVIILAAACTASFAWKPSMHASIAEEARLDAIDGTVSIQVFSSSLKGSPPTQTGGLTGGIRPILPRAETKQYQVDPELVSALKAFPAHYRAGTMGPDAYPDILTGQMIIHADAPGGSQGGSNAWLEHIWRASLALPNGDERLKARAWAAGFLMHGAGDMFAHSYVNHYAGGDFDNKSTNFLRHLVLEGYIAKKHRRPSSTDVSISGIENFIYKTLVDARRGTTLSQTLYQSGNNTFSLPFMLSKLRDKLSDNISDYERHKDDIRRTFNLPLIAYQRRWREDIDSGLKAWPAFSHEVARLLVFFDSDNIREQDKDAELNRIVQNYIDQHLLSMLGAPDIVGVNRTQARAFFSSVREAILPEAIIDSIKESFLNYVAFTFSGGRFETWDEMKDYLKRPEFHFDAVMSASNRPVKNRVPQGEAHSLAQINAALGITATNRSYQTEAFPPSYNTLVMCKMILLSNAGTRSLMSDVGVRAGTAVPGGNFMLGYNRKFDGSAQWKANSTKFILQTAGAFNRVFKPHEGDEPHEDPPAEVPATYRVTVQVIRVRGLDAATDIGSPPDFYARLSVGDETATFDAIDNDNDISPNGWTKSRLVRASTVRVKVRVLDEDGNLAGEDDLCDVNPNTGAREISINLDLASSTFRLAGQTHRLGQNITIRGTQSDAAEVTFKITVARA